MGTDSLETEVLVQPLGELWLIRTKRKNPRHSFTYREYLRSQSVTAVFRNEKKDQQ